jgi:gamma-glutamylaminecyclotransferase
MNLAWLIPRLAFVRTVRRFRMFVAGPWFAPMMLDEPGMGHHVRGELYEVDDGRLATIDGLESVGKPGNFRVILGVGILDGARSWQAFAYMKGRQLATPLHSGYLETYEDRRYSRIRVFEASATHRWLRVRLGFHRSHKETVMAKEITKITSGTLIARRRLKAPTSTT